MPTNVVVYNRSSVSSNINISNLNNLNFRIDRCPYCAINIYLIELLAEIRNANTKLAFNEVIWRTGTLSMICVKQRRRIDNSSFNAVYIRVRKEILNNTRLKDTNA